jgi:hypothetical protein
MDFTARIGKFELEFEQCVTAFLNNWSNVMLQAQQSQGELFDPSAYPDLTDLKHDFRFRVTYRPVTDSHDFRVKMQEDELDALRSQVEQATKESMNNMLRAPLERLKDVVQKLHDVTGKTDRASINKRTGETEVKPPIFRDSVCENIMDEIALLQAFADVLPFEITSLARTVVDVTPHPQQLRDNPEKRKEVNVQTAALLASIETMLED